MSESYILALDQGTTSSRAVVFDRSGAVRGFDQRELPQIFPQPGWVEHDPADIWHGALESARTALRNARVAAADIAAIGITNQRETTILWERESGRAIGNAIVWQDRRTAPLCEALAARGHAEAIRAVTGLVLDPYFSASKIAWRLDRDPVLRERAERGEIAFGTVDSWLIWNLTGGARHVTDYTNASRTMLFDLQTLAWSDEMLALFEIPRAMLPAALPCTANYGTVRPELLGAAIPIAGVAGDQQAALAGHAGFTAGIAKNTYGTGSFVVLNTGEAIVRSTHGLISTIACSFASGQATYALEGSIFMTGAAVQWLRDGLGIIAHADAIETLARTVPDTAGCFFVPAFTGLGAPYWDPHARAAITGLTRGTTRAHIARAALDAMAYQTVDVIRAMERDAGRAVSELRVDGGAAANDLVMQRQADLLGVPVVRPMLLELSALGAASLAGLQIGYWTDVSTLARGRRIERSFTPELTENERQRELHAWHRAVDAARKQ
ncbi:MAG: glycerol kinase GlpK [Candidatus Velthaea sp.]